MCNQEGFFFFKCNGNHETLKVYAVGFLILKILAQNSGNILILHCVASTTFCFFCFICRGNFIISG